MIILALATLVLSIVLFVINRRGIETVKTLAKQAAKIQSLEQALAMVQQENKALINADLIFSRQLADFNQQLVSMEHQIQGLENQRANDGGYQHALRILAMGGDKEEIMKSCHLSNAEAELMINLHAYQTAISTGKTQNNTAP